MKKFFIVSMFSLGFISLSAKSTEIKPLEVKTNSVSDWYWMSICGNEVAFITDTWEEAFDQAFDMWYDGCGPGRQKWDIMF
ncbi:MULTISPECIES: hypothetical protein [Elizabethkingia]|uniref:Uncharacterized protein n=1 Tax=Elizabethkingia miricola TaxID=172045 RepID=A0ABD5B6X0_ELIMR|nr:MULTISPECIES: hypothetical protein [Elizabethkingia]MDQ8749644.1 hypothetical protein [Elizabethkingia miricola]OPB90267.1 hypothetical protein BAS06_08010 [Elizabethkingia miricola]GJN62778.1 hypothetical protein ELAK_29280 [Elizabethkingia anophelis]HDP3255305.1 hypothetical protein [Elizabethkingia anophelis]